MLELEWLEDSVVAGEAPKLSGFGRMMLEKLVGASVGGATEYQVGDGRVVWKLVAPLEGVIRPVSDGDDAAEVRSA